ncbi:MAG TPA: hypothetical protein VEU96_13055 [Bryobacteraceae bacterium]|nr:hypothetical protein [Bryobacteraceae bacterium]
MHAFDAVLEAYTLIMRILFLICLLMIFISVAFGQLDANSITVTGSQSLAAGQPDQAVFTVQVQSGLDTSLDDVIAALQGTGITAAHFFNLNASFGFGGAGGGTGTGTGTGVSGLSPGSGLNWVFQFGAPFAKVKDTVTTLTTLQQSLAKKNNGVVMFFSIDRTQVSTQLQPTCSLSALIADARARAQKIADAGGVGLGSILAMSSVTPNSFIGIFQVPSLGATVTPTPLPMTCSLVAKFALQRF